ncbi:MAG: hypothetical protein E6J89_06890 [Deltaproteobacteria bacterium]|nr:MAG: hypothetical protein E6J89_06890 [Deltaproteobacteria bacterium]
MKDELQRLTDNISRLYEEINQKTESLGQIGTITRLYEELQNHVEEVSTEDVELLQEQIKSTLEHLLNISKSLTVVKALKMMLNGHDEAREMAKTIQKNLDVKRGSNEK